MFGGSHNTLVANIEELYDQYAYGIEKHPMSIRNFINKMIDGSVIDPGYLFLIGKSITAHLYRKDASLFARKLVPTFGSPSSDNMFSSGLSGTIYQPAVPTGRLSATSSADVEGYLEKVEAYETPLPIPPEWTKNILHF